MVLVFYPQCFRVDRKFHHQSTAYIRQSSHQQQQSRHPVAHHGQPRDDLTSSRPRIGRADLRRSVLWWGWMEFGGVGRWFVQQYKHTGSNLAFSYGMISIYYSVHKQPVTQISWIGYISVRLPSVLYLCQQNITLFLMLVGIRIRGVRSTSWLSTNGQ